MPRGRSYMVGKGDCSPMEDPMNSSLRLPIAAIALLAGLSVAAAAENSMSQSASSTAKSTAGKSQMAKNTMAKSTTAKNSMAKSSDGLPHAMDKVSLTSKQRQAAWKDINILAIKEKAPAGFTAKVGIAVPKGLTTYPVPVTTATKVPKLQPYRYAMLKSNKILIVNPHDKKVADVISR